MEKIALKRKDNNLLKAAYANALTDEDFSNLVSSLDTPSEIKMKYTSRLKDAAIEYKNCQNCQGLVSCRNNMKGFKLTPKVSLDAITFSYEACCYKKKLEEETKYLQNVYFFEVPPILKTASFKNIYRDDKNRLEIIKKIKEFYDLYKENKNPKGIYLNGNFGSGKSYLIASLFNELARLGYRSAIIYFPEFLVKLKGNFGNNFGNEYQELFTSIQKVPLLLIDDIGAEKLTDWARDEVLGSILQYRMDYKLPTFFTSNLTIKELENHLQIKSTSADKIKARRIIERIKFQTDEITLIGINRREE